METQVLDWGSIVVAIVSSGVLVAIGSAIRYLINMKSKKKSRGC